MVQELSYDAMFPVRQSSAPPYANVNLSGFGYGGSYPGPGGHGQQPVQYTPQDYVQYADPLQQAPAPGSSCTWTGMYTATSATSPVSRHAGSALLDEWPSHQYVTSVSQGTGQMQNLGGSGAPGFPYRGAGSLPTMPAEYTPAPTSVASSLTPSPTPSGVMGNTPPGVNSVANRQSSRAPYDWMKKQTYPTTPSTGKTPYLFTAQRMSSESNFHLMRSLNS